MRFEFFAVPVVGGEAIAKELNSFLASHRVVQVERVLVPDGPRSLWA